MRIFLLLVFLFPFFSFLNFIISSVYHFFIISIFLIPSVSSFLLSLYYFRLLFLLFMYSTCWLFCFSWLFSFGFVLFSSVVVFECFISCVLVFSVSCSLCWIHLLFFLVSSLFRFIHFGFDPFILFKMILFCCSVCFIFILFFSFFFWSHLIKCVLSLASTYF